MIEVRSVLAYYPVAREACVEPLGNAGGMSGAQFWRTRTADATYVLRRWPREHPTPGRLSLIHSVLRHARARGISFVPVPLPTSKGTTFVIHDEHLWELAPWMSGSADYERSPTLEKLTAAMRSLARFHVAVADAMSGVPALGSADFASRLNADGGAAEHGLGRHLTRLRGIERDGAVTLSRALNDSIWPELAPLGRQYLALLPAALPRAIELVEPLARAELPLQACIRDIWHDHVLFNGDEVTGIIDFGALSVDTRATDVARLLGSLAETPLPNKEAPAEGSETTWRAGLAAYNSVRLLSPDEMRAARALDASGTILAGYNWMRWIYLDQRRFENPHQVIGRFRRIVAKMSP